MVQATRKSPHLSFTLSIILATALLVTLAAFCQTTATAAELDPQESITIAVYSGTTQLEFLKQPLIYHDVVYLPLRETLLKFGLKDDSISWEQDQTIQITAPDGATFHCAIDNNNISGTVGDTSFYKREGVDMYPIQLQTDFAMMNSPMLRDGTTYAPYEFFHHMQIISPTLFAGFSVQCQKGDQPDNTPTLLRLSRNDMIVLSRKSTDGTALTASDFSPFILTWEDVSQGETIRRYDADGGYYIRLHISKDRVTPMLYNDGSAPGYDLKVQSAINIGSCYYDGLPWWNPAE